jgi:hypothetical protein
MFLTLGAGAAKQTVTLRVHDDGEYAQQIETQFMGPGAK